MDQSRIAEILNRHVFEKDKVALIEAIAKNPDRFVGIFRSTTSGLKLLQNLLQSREIRFGDALEEIVSALIEDMGFINLDRQSEDGDLVFDQFFRSRDRTQYYLVEQKVRDDHDSTKKRGQIDNFRKKLSYLKSKHGESLTGIMYFIDPSMHKNERYYQEKINELRNKLKIPIYLFYNGEFFEHFEGHSQTWDLVLSGLQNWRETIPGQITLDYDANPEQTLAELRSVSVGVWRKLIANDVLWEGGVITTLFPNGATLRRLESSFREQDTSKVKGSAGRYSTKTQQLADLLEQRIMKYYP